MLAREGETQLRGVRRVPPREAEKQVLSVQPLPSRQSETQLRNHGKVKCNCLACTGCPHGKRKRETRMRCVQVIPLGQVKFARDQTRAVHYSLVLRV